MFIVYFLLWVILNGRWTAEIGVFGVIFATAIYAFSCRFMGYSFAKDQRIGRSILFAFRYGAKLIVEIIKANLNVIKMILTPGFEPEPHLVQFDVPMEKERHLVAMADSITLTPGTITCNLEGNHFVVHCLDRSLIDGLDNGTLPMMLIEKERMSREADEKKKEEQA